MRKLLVLALGMVMASVLFAGIALAATFQCQNANCYGTNQADVIRERQGNGKQDDIYARGGADRVNASVFSNDTDVLRGQQGPDRLNTQDGDGQDVIICGAGNDNARTDPRDTITESCEFENGVAVNPTAAGVVTDAAALQLVGS